MIEVSGLKKKYHEQMVVNHISFEVKSGEIFGLLGPNGAGKTTTLKMIVGLLKPDEGFVSLDGLRSDVAPIEFKRELGFIPDSLNLYDYLTGREYVQFVASLWDVPKKESQKRIVEMLSHFKLEEKIDDFIKTYSKGMKQKIAMLATMIYKPRVLILDEPLTGLDPESSKVIKNYLRAYADEGNSIIFSTHILEVAERLCDRILIISGGQVVTVGSMEQLRELSTVGDSNLEDIFLQLTGKDETVS